MESISDFGAFKEEVRMNEMLCNKILTSISLCKDDFETVMENNENLCFYWLIFDGIKTIISMKPFAHLESEKKKSQEK